MARWPLSPRDFVPLWNHRLFVHLATGGYRAAQFVMFVVSL
ncbi:hypothetical protein USDA257_p03440 (plasmid) [Sinorhizobium fredii USDA 257]|uniref:Uncharacterized protein n=1 Tax=Sinorhizobium fredii (strain USDA 257) TaxID=1185652 RepID=I3XGQ3_SINF2|nr:hypothetical protein USDA257_p03440 [Sinorhizobium fredii USDA 257]